VAGPAQEMLGFIIMRSLHSLVDLMLAGVGPQLPPRFELVMQRGSAGSLARLVAEVSLMD
jgi:hypothetical protein